MPDDTHQIEGLPPGAIVKPVAPQIEGLPAGAIVRPVATNPAAQPGAIQTHKGAPVQNVNTDISPITNMDMTEFTQRLRSDPNFRRQVSSVRERLPQGMQDTLAQEESVTKSEGEPGISGILTGAGKGIRTSIEGATTLANKALPEGAQLPTGIVPVTPTKGIAEGVGSFGEELAEWAAGDEALKGTVKGLELVQKITKHAPWIIEQAEKFPKAMKLLAFMGKGAVVGGAQAAVKEGDLGAAKGGAEGGAIGAGIGEILPAGAKAVAKQFGIGTTDVEDVMKAAQPYKMKLGFLKDWADAKGRIGQAFEETGEPKTLVEAVDKIGNVRRELWENEIQPIIDEHADETFDTTEAASAVRALADNPAMKRFPKDKQFLVDFANQYTAGSPLFTGEAKVGDVTEEIKKYNAKLDGKGYWDKPPEVRARMEEADPEIAAWRTVSDELRESLFKHLKNAKEPDMAELRKTYGAIGTVERALRGRINVEGRAKSFSFKKAFGALLGIHVGGAKGLAVAAVPIIDAIYNDPIAVFNRAISKATPSVAKNVIAKVAPAVGKTARAAAGVIGKEAGTSSFRTGTSGAAEGGSWVKIMASNGALYEIHPEDLKAALTSDPGSKVIE